MRSRKQKAVRVDLGDDDETGGTDTKGDELKTPTTTFRKRQTAKSKGKPAAALKTSFQQDEGDEDETVILKRTKKKPNSVFTSSTPSNTEPENLYTADHLNELQAKTQQRSNEKKETKEEPEFIGFNNQDENVDADDSEQIDYDIEEGAGFEDEQLPIGKHDKNLQALFHRKEMEDAINEVVSDEEEENEWENSQIQKAVGRSVELPSNEKLPEMEPIPSVTEVVDELSDMLNSLELQKNDYSERITELKEELDRLEHREAVLQESLEKAANDYAIAQEELKKYRSRASGTQ